MKKELWEIGKTYKFESNDGSIYTGTITAVDDTHIAFVDKNGTERMERKCDCKNVRVHKPKPPEGENGAADQGND